MARPANDPTHASLGEAEDGASSSSSSEVSESESEQRQTQKYIVKPSSAASSKPTQAPSKSSSSLGEEDEEEESGSDSGSESEPKTYPSPKEPFATQPMKETLKTSSNAIAPVSPAKSKRSAAALMSEKDTIVNSKRAKKNGDAGTETETGTKKQLFQRLWTDEDEIAVLQGMIDYSSKKKVNPLSDLPDFYNSIRKSLSIAVSTRQLNEKVRRLMIKYENNAKKTKKGKEKALSKAHEKECYALSKKIWGKDGVMTAVGFGTPKINKETAKKVQIQIKSADVIPAEVDTGLEEAAPMENVENDHVLAKRVFGGWVSVGLWDTPEESVKNAWKLFVGPKKSEWEKRSKKVMVEEVEAYLKRIEVTHLKAKLVLEAMKSLEEGTGGSST